ncbi:transposase [Chryseobacterium sp. Bi04]|jgi:hypothetical protein|uniref:transposase n=1 Tax=Chryseobacterium sp. Bi04 TaxID=2822345 RepID=UPI001DF1C8A8|nr:transposase [Chryseobacterium sp. Bi04]CAH0194338.1 hypothetical protein SRABI04_01819 [Chryseobacterium sp. Bi04]
MTNLKEIHIGTIIRLLVTESDIDMSRICNFVNCTEKEVEQIFLAESLDSKLLLRLSKLLEYDLFRIYSQHLIMYAPPRKINSQNNDIREKASAIPQFRKNIYTKEVIDYILEIILNGEMTKNEVIVEYGIPKTTLYTWIRKYSPNS